MLKFNIDNGKTEWCYINDEDLEKITFEGGVAVVQVVALDYEGALHPKFVVLREVKNEDRNVTDYELVTECPALSFSEDITAIYRLGNHFLVEREVYNFDRTFLRAEVMQVDYVDCEGKHVFVERSKLPGRAKLVSNKVVIVKPDDRVESCLFSLEKSDIQSMQFTNIEPLGSDLFLVTDEVVSDVDGKFKDRFMFVMDDTGKRLSAVHMASIGRFTEDDINYPYILIRDRRLNELKDLYKKEKGAKLALKGGF